MNKFEDLLNTSYSDLLKNDGRTCDLKINLPIIKDGKITRQEVFVDGRIDDESKKMLDTFNLLLRKVFSQSMSGQLDSSINYTKQNDEYDFSALISYLSKIFEREMNNSIIQWIRFRMGVEMPEYYNRVKPEVTLDHGLNSTRDGKLATIMIGSIINILQWEKSLLPSQIRKIYQNNYKFWDRLCGYRNASSHTEVINGEQFKDFYAGYCSLVSDGLFTELMDIKDQIRGTD